MHGRPLRIALAGAVIVLLCLFAWIMWRRNAGYGLPLVVQPLAGKSQWASFGGDWVFSETAIENVSDERGAKLVRGSHFWRDYAVEADVQLEGESGDMGLLLRVQEPDEGVDAFRGVYAGLRIPDNVLLAGQADYGWNELLPQPTTTPLKPNSWYHLRASIQGCRLRVDATTTDGKPLASIRSTLPDCSERGQFGLRSYHAGGSWRSIRVSALHDGEAP